MKLSLIDRIIKYFGTQFVAFRNEEGAWSCHTVAVSPLGERYIYVYSYPNVRVLYLNEDHSLSVVRDGKMHEQTGLTWRPL